MVLLGWHLPEDDCDGLMGFSIHRTDHTEDEAYYLSGQKAFQETDPGFPPGTPHSTKDHPVQSFQWSDYTAKPGHDYTYRVSALKGDPKNLTVHAEVEIKITTEAPEAGDHDIYFNRGVAGSQAYARRFGDRGPEEVPNNAAYDWLSRGLMEAMAVFIDECDGGRDGLRVAAYEFRYGPILDRLKATVDRGVDVQIIYDARKEFPRDENRKAVAAAGLASVCKERMEFKSAIQHNKFMVKLREGAPESVWTGGTNFSEGGVFGQSNVAHVVENPDVAQSFLDYWAILHEDLNGEPTRHKVEAISFLPTGKTPAGTIAIFSPRDSIDALNWYADIAFKAREGLMMTFAFGMHDVFKEVYRSGNAPFRLALMEKAAGPKRTKEARKAEERKIQVLRNMPENTFAIGSLIKTNKIDGWVKERLTGLNSHVRYVHNKFMLIDPLGNDPIVVGGSANFSKASTEKNDENMLVVRGDKRVADIYLGEFMRLYSHHAFRESLRFRGSKPPKPLRTDDWWTDYFADTPRSVRRRFFSRSRV
ncbi:phospholipase D-like domain-containing protein [Roseovarius sp. B08]|uniref:phospholipase D-like domain-containing protein n=1 Tax=Roseovarius sp. B08 TaxID=3449223 RepID=UPI003EDB6DBC